MHPRKMVFLELKECIGKSFSIILSGTIFGGWGIPIPTLARPGMLHLYKTVDERGGIFPRVTLALPCPSTYLFFTELRNTCPQASCMIHFVFWFTPMCNNIQMLEVTSFSYYFNMSTWWRKWQECIGTRNAFAFCGVYLGRALCESPRNHVSSKIRVW
jgi:hypothetical protein